jgi:methionyl-tRNA synthetase
MATIDDFHKIEMKIGTILVAEYIEGADKLLRLEVDFGPIEISVDAGSKEEAVGASEDGVVVENKPSRDVRQILSGIREFYEPEALIGKQFPFVTNLAPRTMRGLESHGMILAAKTEEGGAVLLNPDKPVSPGSPLS